MTPPGEDSRVYPDRVPLAEQPAWRQDFPTDVPEDDHVARREFVKFLVLTSGAFAAGQCWIAAAARREPASFPKKRVASVAELEGQRAIQFRYPSEDEPCLALCLGPGRYVAYGQKCSHLSCAVIPHLDQGQLHCPCHNGSFEAETGHPVAGPPRRPLAIVHLEVIDQVVYATRFEPRTI
jgi:nitrite reductase/ring-hydroxylating ferredoxin subunit